jgi:hypothetical protein
MPETASDFGTKIGAAVPQGLLNQISMRVR